MSNHSPKKAIGKNDNLLWRKKLGEKANVERERGHQNRTKSKGRKGREAELNKAEIGKRCPELLVEKENFSLI